MTLRFRAFIVSALAVTMIAVPATADRLRMGDSITLTRAEGGAIVLVDSDDPVIRLVETDGAKVVVRLVIDEASRLVVLRPSEERIVRLRDEFADAPLRATHVSVEVLEGAGAATLNATELRPHAEMNKRRRAVSRPEPKPTSFALIDEAEASGALNSETALLYRVYSLFSDVRLPAQYRGDDRMLIDSLYLGEARERFATLSPATQALVQPFLIPPAYEDSWANLKAGSPVIPLGTPPPCRALSPTWAFVDAATVPVRVWYRVGVPLDVVDASAVAAEINQTIWPKLVGLMFQAPSSAGVPLSDANEPCSGGDGRLDVYLTGIARSQVVNYSDCKQDAAFIELRRGAGNVVVAHEIFHAIQSSFPLNGCMTAKDYNWWTEGSATWAMHFVYPNDNYEHESAPAYLSRPDAELDLNVQAFDYGTYLLPFFVYLTTGSADFVRVAWQNSASQPAIEAFDKAVPGGFEKIWPEFVKYNWNQDPVDDFQKRDGLTSQAARTGKLTIRTTTGTAIYELNTELPHLSAFYRYFSFGPDDTSVVFWNGVTTKLAVRDVTGGFGPQYVNDPASGESTEGAYVRALIRIGESWKEENWTDRPWVSYCRDVRDERIEELVLIISNSDFARSRKLRPPGIPSVLYSSNMGCWKWKGKATFDSGGDGVNTAITKINVEVTWKRPEASTGDPRSIQYQPEGGGTWSVTQRDCNASGPVEVGQATLVSHNFLPTENQRFRTYLGSGLTTISACGGGPLSLPWLLQPSPPIVPGNPLARFLRVSDDGRSMKDSFNIPGGPAFWTWDFTAQRE